MSPPEALYSCMSSLDSCYLDSPHSSRFNYQVLPKPEDTHDSTRHGRGRSVPARASPKESPSGSDNGYDNSKTLTAAIIPSPSISPIPSNGSIITARPISKLLHNADALARMTIELNVRAMATQTARLEKNLSVLMLRTKEDKEFRNTHDARVQSLVQEIQAVKQRMEEIQGPEWSSKSNNDLEQCKNDMHEIIGELKKEMRKEMSDLKGRVGDISSTLDKLPTVAEAEALISHTRVTRSATKGNKTQEKSDAEKIRYVPSKLSHSLFCCITTATTTIYLRVCLRIVSKKQQQKPSNSVSKTPSAQPVAGTAITKAQSSETPLSLSAISSNSRNAMLRWQCTYKRPSNGMSIIAAGPGPRLGRRISSSFVRYWCGRMFLIR
jgi:gas vesicle protein